MPTSNSLGATIERTTTPPPYCGRLIVLNNLYNPHQQSIVGSPTAALAINFPSMPDVIDLVRQTEYRVSSAMTVPDGVHQYAWTAPLSIPFSFVLHSFDQDYCPDGALTLLRVAARLHALVLPIGDSSVNVTVNNDSPLVSESEKSPAAPNPGAKSPQTESNRSAKSAQASNPTFQSQTGQRIDPPVACLLELMYTAQDEPGIVCVGYIKEVKASLKGPWLRGPNQSYNLPTSGEFSFIFVHRPGHTNNYSSLGMNQALFSPQQPQAYADLVRVNLFKTNQLGYNIANNYRGLGEPTGVTAASVSPNASTTPSRAQLLNNTVVTPATTPTIIFP